MLLITVALGVSLLGQEFASPSRVYSFGCGGPDQPERTDFFDKPTAEFVTVAPPADHERWMHRTFLGFDEQKYGFSRVEFFVHPVPTTEYSGDWGDDPSKVTAMQFYVRMVSSTSQKESWYLLKDERQYQREELLFVQPPRNDSDQPGTNESSEPHNPLDDWMALETATPDPHLPLFSLEDQYYEHGANAGGSIENKLLIDLRSGKPLVRTAMQCIHWDGGGACTAPDTTAVHYNHVLCNWDSKESDFLCTDTGPWGGTYNPLNAKSQYFLLGNKQPAQLNWAPEALPSLEAFVKKFRSQSSARALVRGVGYTDLIWKTDSLLPDKELLLLASPGAGEEQNTHFTLAVVGVDGSVTLSEVPKWGIAGEKSNEDAPPQQFTPSDNNRAVSAKEFANVNGAHLLKVVDSLKSPNVIHVVYLVGIEAKDGTLVSNAVRLASEGTTYMGCGFEGADSTAFSFRWIDAEHAASVRVQPQEESSMEEANRGDQPKSCSWEGKLRWVEGTGFRVRKIRDLCTIKPQDVVIDDRGTISAKPRPEREQ
jgi:hypothetical protein